MIEPALSRSGACFLPGRASIRIAGEDRASFLQGLVTNEVEKLDQGAARFAGLLSPQGKVLFEFIVFNAGDAFLIDCASASAPDLIKRLGFYKLRAKVTIEDASAEWRIMAAWGQDDAMGEPKDGILAYLDPRLPQLGWRIFARPEAGKIRLDGTVAAYEALRIGLAVPEGGKDYAFGQVFPHEACFDLLHGADFHKGCYVGQEVVSRMQHRGTARTRVLAATSGGAPLIGDVDIKADGFVVGHLGSVSGAHGIALARLDRVAEAMAKGQSLMAGDMAVTLAPPVWASYALGHLGEAAGQ